VLAGCSAKKLVAQPVVLPPPEVVGTTPAARSTGVVYDTSIAVDFAADMDASTFTTRNVFLKLDTQRVPIDLTWNAASRRLTIVPQAVLQLRRTYTVELGSGVHTAEGGSLGPDGWFFQFTTNGARRPTTMRPLAGAADESPFVMTSWDSTEISVGNISYEVWSGLDSASVAARAGTPTATVPTARWLPTAAWPLGQRVFWAVTVVNATLGERLDGPVQSFATLPPGLAEDSLIVKANDYGYNTIIASVNAAYPYQFCSSDSIVAAGGFQGWMSFPLGGLPADAHLASARLEVYVFDSYTPRLPLTVMTLWSSKWQWVHPCAPRPQLPDLLPSNDLPVAQGRQESGRRVIFMSDLLASHVEAAVRRGGFYGYQFVATQRLAFVTPHYADGAYHPYLKIHFYRTSPAPLAAHAP